MSYLKPVGPTTVLSLISLLTNLCNIKVFLKCTRYWWRTSVQLTIAVQAAVSWIRVLLYRATMSSARYGVKSRAIRKLLDLRCESEIEDIFLWLHINYSYRCINGQHNTYLLICYVPVFFHNLESRLSRWKVPCHVLWTHDKIYVTLVVTRYFASEVLYSIHYPDLLEVCYLFCIVLS